MKSVFTFLFLVIITVTAALPALAQINPPAPIPPAAPAVTTATPPAAAKPIDIQSLGKPIDDDTKSMYDRFVYFDDNTVAHNVPLYQPVLTHLDIQDWLTTHVAELLTLDGPRYQQQVTINQQAFTPKGYGAYRASLDGAQIPKLLVEQGYKLQAVAQGKPNIAAEGVRRSREDPADRGIYSWQTEIDVNLTYSHNGEESNYPVLLVVELVRIPSREDGTLIAIDGWQFSQHVEKIEKKDRPVGRFY